MPTVASGATLAFDNQLRLLPWGSCRSALLPASLDEVANDSSRARRSARDGHCVGGTATRAPGAPRPRASRAADPDDYRTASQLVLDRQTSGNLGSIRTSAGPLRVNAPWPLVGDVTGSSHDTQQLRLLESSDLTGEPPLRRDRHLRRRTATRNEAGNPTSQQRREPAAHASTPSAGPRATATLCAAPRATRRRTTSTFQPGMRPPHYRFDAPGLTRACLSKHLSHPPTTMRLVGERTAAVSPDQATASRERLAAATSAHAAVAVSGPRGTV